MPVSLPFAVHVRDLSATTPSLNRLSSPVSVSRPFSHPGLLGFRWNTPAHIEKMNHLPSSSCPYIVGEREGGGLQESSVSRVSRCCYCCCCDDDSLDDGETRMPSPHCLCSRTCHIICISLYISCIASATATASVSPPASACPSHNVLRHSQTGKVKRNNPLFPPTQHNDIQSQKKKPTKHSRQQQRREIIARESPPERERG